MLPRRLAHLPTRTLPDGRVVAVASSPRSRLLGLAWLDPPPADVALELPGCRSVHTFGMRFGLDLAWLDADGVVLRTDRGVPPRRVRRCRGASGVLELRAGEEGHTDPGFRPAQACAHRAFTVAAHHGPARPRPSGATTRMSASPLAAPAPRAAARRRPRPGVVAAVLALLAAGWLALGGVGGYHYLHRYWLYRGFPPPITPAGVPVGTTKKVHLWSPALGQRRSYLVFLPAGYRRAAARGRRLPVLYLLHPPPGRVSNYLETGALGVRANVLLAQHRLRPTIFVIPDGKDPAVRNDTEWADTRAGRYESFVLDVVRDVDRRFATLADRQHRGIAGLSEGGYGALNVALRHLRTFSVVESWSGYFQQSAVGPFAGAPPAQVAANSPTLYVARLAPEIRRLGLRAFLYQGTHDDIAPWRIRSFSRQLRSAGALVHYGFYRGGHDWRLWRGHLPHMITLASGWFAERPLRSAAPGPLKVAGRPDPPAVRARLRRRLLARCHALVLAPGQRRPKLCDRRAPGRGAPAPARRPA